MSEPEHQHFELCDRCRVKRPLAQLKASRTKCFCVRIDHCDALLKTAPVPKPQSNPNPGAPHAA